MFNYKRRIFSYECDIYGHLNNAEYLKLFEEARSEALTEIGYSLSKLKNLDIALYITNANVDFIKEIGLDSQVIIHSKMTKVSRVLFYWYQKIVNENGNICSKVEISGAFVRDGKPFRVSQNIIETFAKFV
ncbi:MAG: acyl-CoA thioesterase [Candidatus Marinimicrobia bacterium]|nr:acyl-CoA thioesterase [Candidatus Neomarinimicrobiota bacterium]MBL7022491.1 acyl-CoA thioesterase [Candidatus Neomarinimicrobiota bacterium]MBL7108654.1 acyl-CoA thioesterase [Candidatus Neomarinimicrobiota bacterium]